MQEKVRHAARGTTPHISSTPRKSKCDGRTPVCGPCEKAGRATEVRSALSPPPFVLIVCSPSSWVSLLLPTPPIKCSFTRTADIHEYLPSLTLAALQCTWGKETAKKARTQQHFESLENYIRALEAKVKDLQADLEYCRRNHGGLPPSGSSDATGSTSGPVVSDDAIRASGSDEANNDDGGSSNNESDIDHLISPTRHLVVCPRLRLCISY